ncbi:hypothetical protein ES703_113051 [subsurface metagenome]
MIWVVLAVVFLILFYNGLMILGKFGGKQAAVMNIVSGLGIGGIGTWIGFTDQLSAVGPTQSLVAAASCICFAITYFLIAGEIFAGTDFKSLGWHCLAVSIVLFLFGLGFVHVVGTALVFMPEFAFMWIWWAALFFVFFLVWGLGKSGLAKFAGYATIVTAFVTTLYPTIAWMNYLSVGW